MKAETIKTVKTVVSTMVAIGVGAIVSNIIETTSPAKVHIIKKICTSVGGAALGGLVAKQATEYANQTIDEIVETVTKSDETPSGTSTDEVEVVEAAV